MTVYITQEVRGRNISDAASFGDLQILIPAKEQVAYSTQPTVRKISRGLKDFNDEDFRSNFEQQNDAIEVITNKQQLTNQPIIITIRGQCRFSDGKIHADSKEKLVTALIYLNDSWDISGGKLRLLKNNHNLDDYVAEIPPDAGSLVAFVCRPNAWHGHHKFEGKRQTIQINWVRSHKYKIREQIRHTLTANLKKLIGWI